EAMLAEPHAVRGRDGEREHAPAREIVRQLELDLRAAVRVELDGRIEVADVIERRAHRERGAAVAAGVRALELDGLSTDQPRQQAEVPHVERLVRIEARVWVEVAGA